MMATVLVSLGAVPMLTLWTPVGPVSIAARAVSVLITVCCAVMAFMWLTRWPSRRESIAFVLASNACIVASCLATPGQGMALLGCTAFAALAG